MKAIERYEQFKDNSFDQVLLYIKTGKIKCGRYANLFKIQKNKIIKEKELFKNGKNDW